MVKRLERSDFGPNTWLIDEMYRRYLEDPSSVGEAWRDFLEDYQPGQEAPAPQPQPPPQRDAQAPAVEPEARAAPKPVAAAAPGETARPLRGVAATLVQRMEESLEVPTATSVRTLPAKLLEVNRTILNRHLARTKGGKVSFTHVIGWAVVKALRSVPAMTSTFRMIGEKPHLVRPEHVNLGLAVDVERPDGTRSLLVPNIKAADTLDFARFFGAYEELIRKVRSGQPSPDDFAGTSVTITNPGMIGTVQSVPRLMAGQAAIVGVGAIDYPAEFQGSDPETLAEVGIGKVLTLTSTYDHRVIQGAESGEFLATVHHLLIGEDAFYDEVFRSMHVPYVPARWHPDHNPHETLQATEKHARVFQLINMYRVRGHLIADLDPLETKPPRLHPELDPFTFGLTIWDLDRRFVTGGLAGREELPLREILAILRDAYCRTSSVEYMHIQEPEQKQWIQEHVEGVPAALAREEQRHILRKLNEAEAFERFLHAKYVGHKRFSLEGAESLTPMLDVILDRAADAGLHEVVIGMAHRGRLNVLANTVGKSYAQIFDEFEGDIDPETAQGSGDVKYHIGATGKHTSRAGNQVVVTVASNPSHLESVNPVVEGMVRAKQDLIDRPGDFPVLPALIHGDASFAGQGVVAETLALSQLGGYRTGGTVHVIVDNQLGFTTGSTYGRSSTYASDVAKMVQAPIFHVNGDDPEACRRVAELAFDFRRRFHKDVVIDVWCYRRWGHNEADEPSFTQPIMYAAIENRRSVRKLYTETLVNRGDITLEEAEQSLEEFRRALQLAFEETKGGSRPARIEWRRPASIASLPPMETGVERSVLDEIVGELTTVPEGFHLHPKLAGWLEDRRRALEKDAVDWPLGETLAFGSLLREGITVRLSGQDTRRGTFSQRHSVLVDQQTAEEYTPLAGLARAPARLFVNDSLLSELAVLGFEYGYSVANPDALVVWEAQFGDFANGAQVVIDQYVAAAEDKWTQTSGLVMLLPHGYEGQGPEHSSARLERFLQLAAEDNLQVASPSTPAQVFHLLRRQGHRAIRKPLVLMTAKSLLRLPAARSAAAELSGGHFREVLPDPSAPDPGAVRRVVLCQGKIYYDLAGRRARDGTAGLAVVRVEQLYPFPLGQIREQLASFPGAEVWWVQEEPVNMGAWWYMDARSRTELGLGLRVVARQESASPATGSLKIHQAEQAALLEQAFAGL